MSGEELYYVCVRHLELLDARVVLRRCVHRGRCPEGGIEISIVLGPTLVALFVVAAVGGLILVQHLVPSVQRSKHNDVAGFVYAILGVAYAVLLGLMVTVRQSWETADATATEEADELAAIFWLAHGLPESEGRHIQELARSYAREVVHEEWHLMARGEESPEAWAILDEMRAAASRHWTLTPKPPSCSTITSCRASTSWRTPGRSAFCRPTRDLPAILWAVLLIGDVIIVAFTYLFGLQSTLVHTLMVAALALTIALVLFTVGALDYPFKGDIRVRPDAFLSVLKRFERSTLSDL